ncbi:MAG TPA: STAS domain-containing protein [Acidimicrobiales bacterium]|nr:STAS domain-containing protein [Acidimicrobiales bacterium]
MAAIRVHRPHDAPGTVVVAVIGRATADDVSGCCSELRLLLEGGDSCLVVCDVSALAAADAMTVDVIARVALTARRLGRPVQLRHASHDLRRLLTFMGLAHVVGLDGHGRDQDGHGRDPEE